MRRRRLDWPSAGRNGACLQDNGMSVYLIGNMGGYALERPECRKRPKAKVRAGDMNRSRHRTGLAHRPPWPGLRFVEGIHYEFAAYEHEETKR